MSTDARQAVARGLLALLLFATTLGMAGCSAHFCVGSGCESGTIEFGSNFNQPKADGAISIVGKTSTFHLYETVAFVAHLSAKAGAKALTLRVTHGKKTTSTRYPVRLASSNELANLLSNISLRELGVTRPGSYTFRFYRGRKQLATGSLTEK
jgi:hypothetical protein